MEYHVMNVIYTYWKFKNDLTFIFEDMGPFTWALLIVLLSVFVWTTGHLFSKSLHRFD